MSGLIGQTFGQYRLTGLIGEGGMGIVYRAKDLRLHRDVAVKVFPMLSQPSATYAQRVLREAEILARLEHPHIVPIYDFGELAAYTYVAMRLLVGGSLQDRLDEGQFLPSFGEVADFIRTLSLALDHAHSRNIIHRDLKPSNIMFDEFGNPYLVDFGVAKDIEATRLTNTGLIVGTYYYMAPEQCQGFKAIPQTDQYALGVLTYQLVTGQVPFEGPTPYSVMHAHTNDLARPPHDLRPDLPTQASDVIAKAMAKRHQFRYQTTSDFAYNFALAVAEVRGENTHFFTFKVPKKSIEAKLPEPPPLKPSTLTLPIKITKGGFIIMAVMLLLFVFAMTAFFLSQDKNKPRAAASDSFNPPSTIGLVSPTPTQTPIPPTETATIAVESLPAAPAPVFPTDVPSPTEAVILNPEPATLAPPTAAPTEIPPTETPTPPLMPDVPLIAFSSNLNGNYDIFVTDEEGLILRQITRTWASDRSPAWSPDGSYIAFESFRNDNWDIYVVNANNPVEIPLTNDPAREKWAFWSPDGSQIAFSRLAESNQSWDIYAMRPDGSNQSPIINNLWIDIRPIWTPNFIVFTTLRHANYELYRLNVSSGSQNRITEHRHQHILPAVSPDGQWLAFVSNRDGGHDVKNNLYGLYIVRINHELTLDRFTLQNLVADLNMDLTSLLEFGSVSWSPDSTRLAFTARDDDLEIFIYDLRNASLRNLTNNSVDDTSPAWSGH